jgi:hypothetical protein
MLMEYETLLSVIVGAAIGFLTSIGYEWWSESWREGKGKERTHIESHLGFRLLKNTQETFSILLTEMISEVV